VDRFRKFIHFFRSWIQNPIY